MLLKNLVLETLKRINIMKLSNKDVQNLLELSEIMGLSASKTMQKSLQLLSCCLKQRKNGKIAIVSSENNILKMVNFN